MFLHAPALLSRNTMLTTEGVFLNAHLEWQELFQLEAP